MQTFKSPIVKVQNVGISFPSLLALLFIGLRLCGVIAWPWVWILAPLWGPLALALVVLAFAACLYAWANAAEKREKRNTQT